MKSKILRTTFCTLLLSLTLAGCGTPNEISNLESTTDEQSDYSIDHDGDRQDENEKPQEDSAQLQPDSAVLQTDNTPSQSNSELDGVVESIGDNNIVINKIVHESATTSVEYVGDTGVMITVYFSEDTDFEVRTVKNSGINGDSDVEKREGTFSDIKEQVSVTLTGYYEGDDFHADHVIIYHFV